MLWDNVNIIPFSSASAIYRLLVLAILSIMANVQMDSDKFHPIILFPLLLISSLRFCPLINFLHFWGIHHISKSAIALWSHFAQAMSIYDDPIAKRLAVGCANGSEKVLRSFAKRFI